MKNSILRITVRLLLIVMSISVSSVGISSCGNQSAEKKLKAGSEILTDLLGDNNASDESQAVNALLVSPKNPRPGQIFHILAVGGKNLRKAKLVVSGQKGTAESQKK